MAVMILFADRHEGVLMAEAFKARLNDIHIIRLRLRRPGRKSDLFGGPVRFLDKDQTARGIGQGCSPAQRQFDQRFRLIDADDVDAGVDQFVQLQDLLLQTGGHLAHLFLRALLVGHITRRCEEEVTAGFGENIPDQMAIAAPGAEKTVLEGECRLAVPHTLDLLDSLFVIVRMDQLPERTGEKLLPRPAQGMAESGIDFNKIPLPVGNAEQVKGKFEEFFKMLIHEIRWHTVTAFISECKSRQDSHYYGESRSSASRTLSALKA